MWAVSSLTEQYPTPKVGQAVRLNDGKVATVVTVYRANAVLKMMSDAQAIGLATQAQARFGHLWRDVYYQADVMYPSGAMDTVDTSRVKEVFDAA